jgi:hypothetical protein
VPLIAVKKYNINIVNNTLTFTTGFFRAEKSSVLPKGVYSREFSSMLSAAAICVIVYMLLTLFGDMSYAFRIAFLMAVYIIFFLGARKFIFNENELKAVFDKKSGMLEVITSRPLIKKRRTHSLNNIQSVEVGSKQFIPENIDGIRFVEKISAQHGSYVPGLDKTEEFVTLSVKFKDGGEQIIFAGKIEDEPEIPLREINNFLGIIT